MLDGLDKVLDLFMKLFQFIMDNKVSGALAVLWLRAELWGYLERDERKSAQKELGQISKDTSASLKDISEAVKATNALWEKVLAVWDKVLMALGQSGKHK